MPVYGPLAAPALGMLTQSSAFGTISLNITNLNTGGYKATDTRFSTVLASQFDNNFDIGGVKAVRKTYVSQQGNTVSSTNFNDIAINGRGLFVVNSQLDGSGEQLYTRDGALQTLKGPVVSVSGVFRSDGSFDTSGNTPGTTVTVNTNEAYLTDKNGHYLQGYPADALGGFTVGGATVPIRIDQFAFNSDAAATTNASVAGNLPALDAAGTTHDMMASIFDSTGATKTFSLEWTKSTNIQEWALTVVPTDTAIAPLPTSETFTFDSSGRIADGTTHNFTVNWADGQTSTVALDISDITSIGGGFQYTNFLKDGRTPGDLQSYSFDDEGQVLGIFTNGVTRALYKLPLATFANEDALEVRQGNLFAESLESGTVTLREAGLTGFAQITPFATELSNTNLQNEFTKMIMAQQAYSLSGSVFKSVDEMTQEAANLKS